MLTWITTDGPCSRLISALLGRGNFDNYGVWRRFYEIVSVRVSTGGINVSSRLDARMERMVHRHGGSMTMDCTLLLS